MTWFRDSHPLPALAPSHLPSEARKDGAITEEQSMQEPSRPPARSFHLAACQKCGGTAYLDQSEEPQWRCLQCGKAVDWDSGLGGSLSPTPLADFLGRRRETNH